jgi:hypothetical protein
MRRRKTEEVRLLGDIGNSNRTPLPEQDAKDTVIAGQIADPGSCRVINPDCDETL